jgi:hypothetical protein
LTEEQKQKVKEDAERKTAVLDSAYNSEDSGDVHENNLIGAYAEAVFGASFGLPIFLGECCDGGVDFRLPDGTTVDVKATRHDDPPHLREGFIRRPDHVFAYIQVVDLKHAFFRGFAFGSDGFVLCGEQFGRPAGYEPGRELRKPEELRNGMGKKS